MAPAIRQKLASLPFAVGASVVLLLLLAALQYRWIGQLSDAERTQWRLGTKTRADALARDFDREVTRAFLGLSMDPDTLRQRAFDQYADRYDGWLRRAQHPELVKDVFLVERPGEEHHKDTKATKDETTLWTTTISRFAASRRTFEAAEWPAELLGLRDRIERHGRDDPGADRSFRRGLADLVSGDVPTLTLPILGFPQSSRPGPRPAPGPSRGDFQPSAYVIAVLDLDHIRREVLPALTERHFGAAGVIDCNLVVLTQAEPRSVVWRSSPNAPVSPSGDVAAGMLELRFEEAGPDAFAGFGGRSLSDAGRRPPPSSPGSQGRRIGFLGSRGGGRAYTEDSGRWRLVATHQAGSVDNLVAMVRLRNLGVSFGILTLLGASTALVLASAQRARRLAERQVEFVAGVSHELRTPAAVICSAAENLADGIVADPVQVRRYGAVLRDEGRRLAEMVEQVLEFAGTYSGKRVYRSESIEVPRLLDEVLEASEGELRRSGFTVAREIATDLPLVLGDGAALRRALQNLLTNAVKYGEEGRWLGVRAAVAAPSGRAEVRITVEDRGRGIPLGDLANVFEPFFRGQEAVAAQARGFGLGLSLVKRVVEAHGGRVTVESAPGKGTTFTIHLPAAPSSAADAPEPAHGVAHPSR